MCYWNWRIMPLRRVALKRRFYHRKGVPIRRMSKKRKAEAAGRRAFVAKLLAERPWCQIGRCVPKNGSLWNARSVDVHEKIPRSAMGAIVPGEKADEQGQVFFAVCRACHDYIHLHPKWAKEEGWLK